MNQTEETPSGRFWVLLWIGRTNINHSDLWTLNQFVTEAKWMFVLLKILLERDGQHKKAHAGPKTQLLFYWLLITEMIVDRCSTGSDSTKQSILIIFVLKNFHYCLKATD